MNTQDERAPGAGSTGGISDQVDARSRSTDPLDSDKTRLARTELQLLGCLLHATTADQVKAITYAVPAEVFTDPLNAAVWRTLEFLAKNNICHAPSVPMLTVQAKMWPKDLHHEVTARVVDAITDCVFPDAWRPLAAEVLDAHARRTTARHLAGVAASLRTAHLNDVCKGLLTAAEIVEIAAGWIKHVVPTDVQEIA